MAATMVDEAARTAPRPDVTDAAAEIVDAAGRSGVASAVRDADAANVTLAER